MNPAQTLSCEAQFIKRWLCKNPGMEMAVLISLFAKIANVTINCQTLEALAAQYNCLPRQDQLPAMIYLVNQLVANGAFLLPVDYIPYPGPPAVAPGLTFNGSGPYLNIIVDVEGVQWQFFNGGWN